MLHHRLASPEDAKLLGNMNKGLIEDEGHANPMSASELSDRMTQWMADKSHEIVVFLDEDEVVGYAVYRPASEHVYLRQLYVTSSRRKKGLGREMLQQLQEHYFTASRKIRLDVLIGNAAAHDFYRACGFSDYCITMEKKVQG